MAVKKHGPLPSNHHVVRYVPWAKLRKDEHDGVIGILGEAFRQREDEKYLSVDWLEYPGEPDTRSREEMALASARRIRNSNLAVKPKSGFVIGEVGQIQARCRELKQIKVFVTYEPSLSNQAHAAVKKLPREDMELQEDLANGVWSELHLNTHLPK
jgi:hypothetical protein